MRRQWEEHLTLLARLRSHKTKMMMNSELLLLIPCCHKDTPTPLP